jgi:hypothetical protein
MRQESSRGQTERDPQMLPQSDLEKPPKTSVKVTNISNTLLLPIDAHNVKNV